MRGLIALGLCLLPSLAPADGFFTLKGHGGPVMDIAVAADGRIATASFDNSVGLWSGQTPHWFEGHEAAVNTVAFGGQQTLVSAGDDFSIRLWSPDGVRSTIIGSHKGKVMRVAVSPDRRTIASASWDGTIGLWRLQPPVNGTGWEAERTLLSGHDGGVNDVVFSSDGTRLYSASVDGTVRVWDLTTDTELRQLIRHGFGVNELVLNEAAGWLAYGAVDGVTRIVDAASGDEIRDFTLDRRPILALALSSDASQLAVGDGEGYIMVIDTANWRIVRDFRATLRGPVWALAFSADGANIHAGGLDDAMYSWPIETLDEHQQMVTDERSFLRNPDEMDNGERQFARKCSICHALTPGSARRAGPTLHGVFGRRAGTVPDYSYSATLDGSEIIWGEDSINALFDVGPDHYIPGTKMPMQRITDPDDRADLIAYLRQATQQEKSQ